MPLILELKDKSMEVPDDRHWAKIRGETKSEFKIGEATTMQLLW